jgi:Co/Zn/Cd efflux system component
MAATYTKSIFEVKLMDCPSEAAMIRMQLQGKESVKAVHCDVSSRTAEIIHSGSAEDILNALQPLQLGTSLLESRDAGEMAGQAADTHGKERRLLKAVLWINLSFFFVEGFAGYWAGSTGLMADGADMLADALVYGLALMAVASGADRQRRAALAASLLQAAVALYAFFEVLERWINPTKLPDFRWMIYASLGALAANIACLYLLRQQESSKAHIRASVIFTSNDILANLGVMMAAGLVWFSNSKIPDLIIGSLVLLLVLHGAVRIYRISRVK